MAAGAGSCVIAEQAAGRAIPAASGGCQVLAAAEMVAGRHFEKLGLL